MVTTLHHFWSKHRKHIILGILLVMGAMALPHLVHAQGTGTANVPDQSGDLLNGLSKVVGILQRVFWPVLLMIGSLMQNDILFGAGMEQRLLEVWVNIRNIVNILFVLVLLGIALYNVVGAGENYHFKTILPKFIIALIAVNFTFIGMKVVLDGVNIVSTALFALPDSVEKTLKSGGPSGSDKIGILSIEEANGICGAIYGGVNINEPEGKASYQQNLAEAQKQNPNTFCQPEPGGTPSTYMRSSAVKFFSGMNAKNAALVMAVTLGRANLFDKVYVNAKKLTMGNLVLNTLFTIILYVVYGTAYVALFVTLLIRLVALWVMIAISPLIVLPAVLPENIKGMLGEGGEIGKKFIKNAIVPIPVALVMSVGFVMLRGLQSANLSTSPDPFINNPTLSLDLLTSGITSLQQLIVCGGMVAFVWVGVFEAMKGTYAEHAVDAIKNTVSGAGKALGKFAVGSIPLFPTARGPVTVGALGVGLQAMQNVPRNKFQRQAETLFPEIMGKTTEVGRKLGEQKDLPGFKKAMGEVSRSMLPDGNVQKGMSEFFEKDGKKYVNSDLKKWLTGTSYNGDTKKFLEDLKAGKVTQQDMEIMYQNAGVSPASGLLDAKPKDAKEAAAEGKLPPNQEALLDKKKRTADEAYLTADQKKRLDEIDKTLKDKKANPDDVKKAKEDLAKIAQDVETKKGSLTSTIGFTITDNVKGPGVNASVGPTEANAKAIDDALVKKAEELSGAKKGTPEYAAAEAKVVQAAVDNMDADAADKLEKASASLPADSPLKKAIAERRKKSPAKPGTPGAPGAGGAKPASPPPGGGTPKPGAAGPKPGAPSPQPGMPAGGPNVASVAVTDRKKGTDNKWYIGDGLGGWKLDAKQTD